MAKRSARLVLLGAGAAALSAKEAIRSINPDCQITVVSGEPGLPYARMAIPYYVNGKIPISGLLTRSRKDFDGPNTRYIAGDPAVYLNVKSQKVLLKSGKILQYDKLLIATGSQP